MLASNIPPKFPIPFANNAGASYIRTIPQAHQTPSGSDAPASLYDGFQSLNFQPESSGGIPPNGADFNGILNWITEALQWMQAGGPAIYDGTFQSAIGGYPKGAIIQSATTSGKQYMSTADNNTTNPDSGGAGWLTLFDEGYDSGTGITWRIWPKGDGKRMIRLAGTLAFSNETNENANWSTLFSLASVTDWGVCTVIPYAGSSFDQGAQVVGTPSTSSITIQMQIYGGGVSSWPCSGRWWVEGILS